MVSVVGSRLRAGSPRYVAGLSLRVFSPYLPLLTHGLRASSPCLPLLCLTFVAHRWALALGLRVFSLHLSLLIQAPRIALLHLPLLGHELTALSSHSRPLYLTVFGAVSPSLPPFLSRPAPSRPRSCVPASAGLETCDGHLADVCSSDVLRAAADDLRCASLVCCGGAQEASLAACDGLRTASGSSSAVRAVDRREGGTARAGGSRV